MSLTTTDLPAIAQRAGSVGPGLAWRVRRWLRQRRQAAVLRMVDDRLREDAGLPKAPSPAARVPMLWGG